MKAEAGAVPLGGFLARENAVLVAARGFRDYDARWRYPDEINPAGMQAVGMGLGTLLQEMAREGGDAADAEAARRIVVGRDFRAYSPTVAQALCLGLVRAGMEVLDIGLALSPTAYFARSALDAPAVAMVTASHNENGWTGLKMGARPPLTFGSEEMARLREIVLGGGGFARSGGSYRPVADFARRHIEDLTARTGFVAALRIVVACGNGTAGMFAPEVLRRLGARVVELDCVPDAAFPNYEPNPEHVKMLAALRASVLREGADLGLAFDGDGDRIGVVDARGRVLFADKVGLLLARDLAARAQGAKFVVDAKTSGIWRRDEELRRLGAQVAYWKTGHSHIKARILETGALAGFEKSGHWFFAPPFGRGYDDALLGAVLLCELLCRQGRGLAELYDGLEASFVSPTIGARCADEKKHEVVAAVAAEYEGVMREGDAIAGRGIAEIVAVDGVRFVLADGSWGLLRASSNKPSLVVVVESLVSSEDMAAIFADIDARLQRFGEVGEYDQEIGGLGG